VTRLLSVPGVADHAIGFKSMAEAVYLRDPPAYSGSTLGCGP